MQHCRSYGDTPIADSVCGPWPDVTCATACRSPGSGLLRGARGRDRREPHKAGVGGCFPAQGSYPMRVACAFCLSAGAPVLEGAPVRLGAGVHGPAEVLPEVGCRGKAAFLRDGSYRQVAHFEESLGELDALAH